MFQLEPSETFIITRQITDPADTNTYYLRAYIRNAESDTLLDTVNLTDKGDQRFRGNWHVPVDGSGLGFYVTITVLVFTDSGYTTESKRYARTEQVYLIQQRFNPMLGGGGGADVNYKKVRRIIQEELKRLPQPIEPEDINWTPILEKIRDNYEKISSIKFPHQKEVDLGPILKTIKEVERAIQLIRIPEPEKIDLSPAMKELSKVLGKVEDLFNKMDELFTMMESGSKKEFEEIRKSLIEETRKSLKRDIVLKIGETPEEKPKKRRAFL